MRVASPEMSQQVRRVVLLTTIGVVVGLAAGMAACRAGDDLDAEMPGNAADAAAYPAGFSLVFTVENDATRNGSVLRQPAQHVVLSDRVLRAAVGPGAHADFFPGPTATLTPEEMQDLWNHVVASGILEQNTTERDTPGPVRYRVAVTVDGTRRVVMVSPDQHPGVRALLRRLIALRGEQPSE